MSLTFSAEGLDEEASSLFGISEEGGSEIAAARWPDYSQRLQSRIFPTSLPQTCLKIPHLSLEILKN